MSTATATATANSRATRATTTPAAKRVVRPALVANAPDLNTPAHPAENAGATVHQAIESTVGTVAGAAVTGVVYVGMFLKGLAFGKDKPEDK